MQPNVAWRDPIVSKMVFVGALVLILLVPIGWIRSLVWERQGRAQEVEREIASTWGGEQTLAGPVLVVPYVTRWKDEKGAERTSSHLAHFLPETLSVEGRVAPEVRSRGIFDVVLYRAALRVTGRFAWPDLSRWKVPPADVDFASARVVVGVSDPRGVAARPVLAWGGTEVELQPGTGLAAIPAGMAAAAPGVEAEGASREFALDLAVAGSGSLAFVPAGKETRVRLESPWPSPSFSGAFLPAERAVGADGFRADWQVSWLARAYPQAWTTAGRGEPDAAALAASAFGLRLIEPVDLYRKAERSVKYAALFVVLTFLAFALFEILAGLRVHPVQYLLVGLAVCLFYVVLLAASEHAGFGPAYALASAATIALVAGYAAKALRGGRRGATVGGLLAGLYAYLYVLLQLEGWALALGTAGLFAILATVMWVTRDLDWYALEPRAPRAAA